MKTRIIGLTGQIAAGKNEVAKVLRRLGARVIDADAVGRSLLVPQSDTWKKLVSVFGSKVLHPGGSVNRKRLGELVFGDRKALKKLNGIMHPQIKRAIVSEIRKLRAGSRRPIVVNAAVLREIGLVPYVDEIWAVVSSSGRRLARLIRRGMSKGAAVARMGFQMREKAYVALADKVIRNNGTKNELKRKVISLYRM